MDSENAKYNSFLETIELYKKLKKKYRDRDVFDLHMVNDDFFHNHVWEYFLDLSHEEHRSLENEIYDSDIDYHKIKKNIENYSAKDIRTFKAFFEMEYEKY